MGTIAASATSAAPLEFATINGRTTSSEGRVIPEDESVEFSPVSVPCAGSDACWSEEGPGVPKSLVEPGAFCGVEELESAESVVLLIPLPETLEFIEFGLTAASEFAELAVELEATVWSWSGVTLAEGKSAGCKREWELATDDGDTLDETSTVLFRPVPNSSTVLGDFASVVSFPEDVDTFISAAAGGSGISGIDVESFSFFWI